jgi:hypothetical protein
LQLGRISWRSSHRRDIRSPVHSGVNADKAEAIEVETGMTHNARHRSGSDSRRFSPSVPEFRESTLRDRAIFRANSTTATV